MSRNQMAELVKYATGVFVCRRKGCAPEGGFSPLPYISQADCFFCPVSSGEGCLGGETKACFVCWFIPKSELML